MPVPGTPTARPGPPRPARSSTRAWPGPAARGPVPRAASGGHPGQAAAADDRALVQRDRRRAGRADRPAAHDHGPGPVPDGGRDPAGGRHRRPAVRFRDARAHGGRGRPHGHGRGRFHPVRRPLRAGRPQAGRADPDDGFPQRRPRPGAVRRGSEPPAERGQPGHGAARPAGHRPVHPRRHAGAVAYRRVRQPRPPGRHHAPQPAGLHGRHRQPGHPQRPRDEQPGVGPAGHPRRACLDRGRQLPGHPADQDVRRVLGPGGHHRAGEHDRPAQGHRRPARRQTWSSPAPTTPSTPPAR